MAYESLVVEAFVKSQKKNPAFKRSSSRSPVSKGQTRGMMGSTGAHPFKGRDSEAGMKKEQKIMQSPVFQAYMKQIVTQTPVSNFLRRIG